MRSDVSWNDQVLGSEQCRDTSTPVRNPSRNVSRRCRRRLLSDGSNDHDHDHNHYHYDHNHNHDDHNHNHNHDNHDDHDSRADHHNIDNIDNDDSHIHDVFNVHDIDINHNINNDINNDINNSGRDNDDRCPIVDHDNHCIFDPHGFYFHHHAAFDAGHRTATTHAGARRHQSRITAHDDSQHHDHSSAGGTHAGCAHARCTRGNNNDDDSVDNHLDPGT